ncbi:MAG: ABC transporter permease [Armatimonadota bacterium]
MADPGHGVDGELRQIVLLTLQVTGLATALAAVAGIPTGAVVGLFRFRGRGTVLSLLYTGMGLPPVVVGLALYLLLSREGPLGALGWLFSPEGMVLAQTLIAFPVIASLSAAAVGGVDPELRLQLRALGAQPWQEGLLVLREASGGIVAALIAGFGSVISEVGAVMMVGGNVKGETRVVTTAIVLETRQGHFELALGLGVVLLGVTLMASALLLLLQGRAER